MGAGKNSLDIECRPRILKPSVSPTGTRTDPGIPYRMVDSLDVSRYTLGIYPSRHAHGVEQEHGVYPFLRVENLRDANAGGATPTMTNEEYRLRVFVVDVASDVIDCKPSDTIGSKTTRVRPVEILSRAWPRCVGKMDRP